MSDEKITGYVQAVSFSPGAHYFREINLTVTPDANSTKEGETYILDGEWVIGEGIEAMRVKNWGLTQYLGHATRRVRVALTSPKGGYDCVIHGGTFVEENPR